MTTPNVSPGRLLMLFVMVSVLGMASAEAAVTVQTFQPPVNVKSEGEESWNPLTQGMQLDAGHYIMTESGGFVDLLFEDGSTLHIDEETQLAIRELEFSEAQQVRVSRLKLLWGSIFAKAAPKAYQKNVFEVETNTVLARFKFSSMGIFAQRTEVLGETPLTRLTPIEGKFDLQQVAEGVTEVECTLEGTSGAGLRFSMGPGVVVALEIDQTRKAIAVKSNRELSNFRTLLTGVANLLRVENAAQAPIIGVGFQQYQITIGQGSTGTLGFSTTQARQQLAVGAQGIDGLFIFGQTSDIPLDHMYVLAGQGNVAVNDQRLTPGTSVLLPIGEVPAIIHPEKPVAPPAPKEAPRGRGTGSPVEPEKPKP